MLINPGNSRQTFGAFVCIFVASWTTCACQPAPGVPTPRTLRVAAGPPRSFSYQLGEMMADRLKLPGVDIRVDSGTLDILAVKALQRGEADIVIAAADAAYYSFWGELDADTPPFEGLRGITVLQPIPLVLVVGPRSGIHQISQLRGRTVGIGAPGSTGESMALNVLRAFEVDAKIVHLQKSTDAAQKVADGELDALFVGTSLDGVGLEGFASVGARVLPLTGPAAVHLFRTTPFLQPAVVRPKFHGSGPIETVAAEGVLVCRRDLDEELVYEFTKAFFDLVLSVPTDLAALRFMNVELAPATPIPLHEGAARYYREREMSR